MFRDFQHALLTKHVKLSASIHHGRHSTKRTRSTGVTGVSDLAHRSPYSSLLFHYTVAYFHTQASTLLNSTLATAMTWSHLTDLQVPNLGPCATPTGKSLTGRPINPLDYIDPLSLFLCLPFSHSDQAPHSSDPYACWLSVSHDYVHKKKKKLKRKPVLKHTHTHTHSRYASVII